MSDRRNSMRARRICVETHGREDHLGRIYMVCFCCGAIIYPKDARTPWRGDHITRWADGGRDTADNLRPICLRCDAGKNGKAAHDTKIIAHGKRVGAKQMGWRRRGSRPLPGTKSSGIRIRMNGTVEKW